MAATTPGSSTTTPLTPTSSCSGPTPSPTCASRASSVLIFDGSTTGIRLADEFTELTLAAIPEPNNDNNENHVGNGNNVYSCHVMPYGEPNALSRQKFGLRTTEIGKCRVLQCQESGKVLKTITTTHAMRNLLDFIIKNGGNSIIIYYEVTRKCLVPLLLLALKSNLMLDEFAKFVKGFVNAAQIVENQRKTQTHITSTSLRSLCKTVLGEPTLSTRSSRDRVAIVQRILEKVTNSPLNQLDLTPYVVDLGHAVADLASLQSRVHYQSRLRPLFQAELKSRRSCRERAVELRDLLADAGLDLKQLEKTFKKHEDNGDKEETKEMVKREVNSLAPKCSEEQLELLFNLMTDFFRSKAITKKERKSHNRQRRNV